MSPKIPANVFLRFFIVSSPSWRSDDFPSDGAPTPMGGGCVPGGTLKIKNMVRFVFLFDGV